MANNTKKEESLDLIQQCIRDDTIVFGFTIPNPLVDKFVALVKEKKLKESPVLVSLVEKWIHENQRVEK